jgi:uncharacterized protein YbjT (DUF2867 family)
MSKKIIAIMGATGAQGGGLAQAIAADTDGPFTARAITRNPKSDKANALRALGVDVVAGDADDPESLESAFDGAYGAFCVTNFWEHLSVVREGAQATAMANATKQAGLQHVVWSTLEDTRKQIPLTDGRMPVLHGQFFVPHFDSKGQMDQVFTDDAAPTSFLLAAFYWDNFIHFGMGPRKGDDGTISLALPLGGAKLPGIWSGDIGRCALGIFKQGPSAAGQSFGVAGEILSGPEMAAKMGAMLGQTITFVDVPFDVFRGLGFPGAEDLGNMFQYQAILGDAFLRARDPKVARALNPALLTFDAWLAANKGKIAIG